MADKTNANIGFEKQLWDAACVLWGHIPAAEYRKVIIGLIFLRYISAAFDKRYQEVVADGDGFEDDLDRRIQNLSPDVKREFKKLYVSYKLDTNFVDIVFQKQRLRISVNMKFSEVIDPNGICRDITGLGRWGNGDVELYMEHTSDVDQIMEIVEQSYRLQADE